MDQQRGMKEILADMVYMIETYCMESHKHGPLDKNQMRALLREAQYLLKVNQEQVESMNDLDKVENFLTWVSRDLSGTQYKEMYDESISCLANIARIKHNIQEIEKETQSTKRAYAAYNFLKKLSRKENTKCHQYKQTSRTHNYIMT